MNEGVAQPSELPIAVVGAGFSGVAAAWSAARAGARVVVIHDVAGASELYSGLVDGAAPGAEVGELAAALGLILTEEPRAVATREGAVRAVRGRDRSVLDLTALAGREICVADVGRDDWDPALVAPAFSASAWAAGTGTRFRAVRVPALLAGAERRIASHDFAVRFDAAERREAFAAALRTAAPGAEAWLTGPWLGLAGGVAGELAARLGCPVGETSSAPGGVAGARFERARRALLEATPGVELLRRRAHELRGEAGALTLELDGGEPLPVRAAVLAIGGVVAGGIELAGGGVGLEPSFRLSLRAPVALELDGEVFGTVSSLHGPSFVRFDLDALERIGIRADRAGRASPLPIYAAGDALAARPKSVVGALSSGIEAGRNAARRFEIAYGGALE